MIRIVVCLFILAVPGWAEEYQRVGSEKSEVHRWQIGSGATLVPYGFGQWSVGISPYGSYEYARTWSASWARPYSWTSDPTKPRIKGAWESGEFNLGWSGRAFDLRWQLSMTAVPGSPLSFEAGTTMVRDPAFLGASVGVALPQRERGLVGQGSLYFQEVLNDNLTWTFVLSPRWLRYQGLTVWSLGAVWRLSWYEGPYSVSSGISAGSGGSWSWSSSLARSWDFN